ncbi:hypothetical protein D0466_10780 [Peribacillus glennii]|uniref:Uncharacterized protein n=1 Tax=Peribacillus glennii TaxID=2303991 RepID=A0A372LE89_9BACI|nr:hypothetical protein D0466_10780 [Peribacillus glennii]
MKINVFLNNLACMMILIFGGTLLLRYFRTGELLVDQVIGILIGVILLMASFIWRKKLRREKDGTAKPAHFENRKNPA